MRAQILMAIAAELDRARQLHPTWPTCNIKRVALMMEEAGEAVREANNLADGVGTIANLRTELIQTAAMCLRVLEEMDKPAPEPDRYYTNDL